MTKLAICARIKYGAHRTIDLYIHFDTQEAALPPKHRVQIMREERGLSIKELASLADIHPDTLRGIERGKEFKTHHTVASGLAAALNVHWSELFLPIELSGVGRHAGSGSELIYTRTEVVIEQRTTITTESSYVSPRETQCLGCFQLVPAREHCWSCGAELDQI